MRAFATVLIALVPIVGAAFVPVVGKTGGRAAKPHMDHTPKHGGVFFMAPDGFHHLEGVYERPGVLRIYMYDDYSVPIRANGFRGDVSLSESANGRTVSLSEAADGTLAAPFPLSAFPATLDVWIEFPAKNGKPASREIFTFAFGDFSDAVASAAKTAHCAPE